MRPIRYVAYQSDLLLWDHETESFWSQIEGRAVVGPAVGERLEFLPVANTTWRRWRERHPKTRVLSIDQGIYPPAAYEATPYPGYAESERVLFPLGRRSDRFPAKAIVSGVVIGEAAKAYPHSELRKAAATTFEDRIDGVPVRISFDREADTVHVERADDAPVPVLRAYWFAWHAFHPESQVYSAPGPR